VKILAFESSAKAASVALCDDDRLIAQAYQNSGLTHSTTLLPMAQSMLTNCGETLEGVDCFAVSVGPGSFTGLRIGISTVKGLAWGLEKPCAGVSTLEAMAWNLAHMDAVICCAMDARRQQVYNALFRAHNGSLERLTPDRAISLEELAQERESLQMAQIVVGDGAQLCYNDAIRRGQSLQLAPAHLLHQNAWGVAQCALAQARKGELISGAELSAHYLRLSQAERERMEREQAHK
jgi:tRNA threonylcarbamoyladenosine biosynthesis protein TsaB